MFTGKVSKEDMSKTAKPYYKAMADDIARYNQQEAMESSAFPDKIKIELMKFKI